MPEAVETQCDTQSVGARRLMAAVLLDAVADLRERGSKAAAEAERWISAPYAPWAPFSFATVCEALGLDPAYLARGLLGGRLCGPADDRLRFPSRRTLAVEGRRRIALAKPRHR